jgi:carbon-monoxide dehydrogenase large subunit
MDRAEAKAPASPGRGEIFGARVKRVEDPALLRGRGRFIDDIHLPGMLHAAFVRSPHAHAEINGISIDAALSVDGCRGVYTIDDLSPHVERETLPVGMPSSALRQVLDPPVLARREVCHVGEPVAVVVADDPYSAEDAAHAVDVDYRVLAAASECGESLEAESALAHLGAADNVVGEFTLEYGDCRQAFAEAPHVFAETFFQHKGLGHAIECRGVIARWDGLDERLTVWSGTQMAHRARAVLADLLGWDEERIRVIAPDVGGGFGPKFVFYPEEAVVPLLAKLLDRPVKWIEDRREHFLAATQERDQHWAVEVAADAGGKLLGLRGKLIHDHGAYTPYGINLPYNSATNLIGPYELPNYALDVTLVATNKTPVTPVRGAGRPQGTFVMERMLDRIASELRLDRVEVRRRNLIGPEQMPYRTPVRTRDGSAMTYDSGDYPGCMDDALSRAGYEGFSIRRDEARRQGRYLGIGIANYVEGTGRGPFESAKVRIAPSGRVFVYSGATAQGQGVATALAQVCAQQLGVPMERIAVETGDSSEVPFGLGAFGSRQAVTAGSAVHVASGAVKEKAAKVAAHLLEVSEEDIEFSDGAAHVRGVRDLSMPLGDIAAALAGLPGLSLPGTDEPGLEATTNYAPETLTYCNGTHVAEVEVDPETGAVEILNYVVAHDSGRLINPMIVEGQIIGGYAHGLGNALLERMVFDGAGQPQTITFADYLLPTSTTVARADLIHRQSPSPFNPLGVKGAGEGGTIPTPAAIVSAIENALSPFSVRISECPITPKRIVELIARRSNAGDIGP